MCISTISCFVSILPNAGLEAQNFPEPEKFNKSAEILVFLMSVSASTHIFKAHGVNSLLQKEIRIMV